MKHRRNRPVSRQFLFTLELKNVLSSTMLQDGRSRVRFPIRSFFFNWRNSSSRTMALGSARPRTEMNTRTLSGGKGWPERKADNLTAIYEPIVSKMWEPRRLTIV
jgi:hypothetical protein